MVDEKENQERVGPGIFTNNGTINPGGTGLLWIYASQPSQYTFPGGPTNQVFSTFYPTPLGATDTTAFKSDSDPIPPPPPTPPSPGGEGFAEELAEQEQQAQQQEQPNCEVGGESLPGAAGGGCPPQGYSMEYIQ